jgi:hypothetical protein
LDHRVLKELKDRKEKAVLQDLLGRLESLVRLVVQRRDRASEPTFCVKNEY